jgi:hypothetical protein
MNQAVIAFREFLQQKGMEESTLAQSLLESFRLILEYIDWTTRTYASNISLEQAKAANIETNTITASGLSISQQESWRWLNGNVNALEMLWKQGTISESEYWRRRERVVSMPLYQWLKLLQEAASVETRFAPTVSKTGSSRTTETTKKPLFQTFSEAGFGSFGNVFYPYGDK